MHKLTEETLKSYLQNAFLCNFSVKPPKVSASVMVVFPGVGIFEILAKTDFKRGSVQLSPSHMQLRTGEDTNAAGSQRGPSPLPCHLNSNLGGKSD